jgi:hypothetical protein
MEKNGKLNQIPEQVSPYPLIEIHYADPDLLRILTDIVLPGDLGKGRQDYGA